MEKFLQLCEQLDPTIGGNDKWALIDLLKSKGIAVSPVRDSNMLYIDTGDKVIAVEVLQNEAEEEAEEVSKEYGVDQSVSDLSTDKNQANTPMGKEAQRATRERAMVGGQAINTFRKRTQQLQKDIQNAQRTQ